jgi:S-adenosylmethionine synthetase
MFGYATDENSDYMPTPINLAHQLVYKLSQARKEGVLPFILPDGKSQVSVRYENDKPVAVEKVLISSQHIDSATHKMLTEGIIEEVIKKVIPAELLSKNVEYLINPTGKFVVGGPVADTGLTGRKIIVDTYGGIGAHGGGAFSGKCVTKVDRSGAYMARYVAKNIIAAGLAERCQVQVAYAIGVAEPVGVYVHTFDTNKISEDTIIELVKKHFDFKPKAIVEKLNMKRPIYQKTAAYGHFGRDDKDFTWEATDKADVLREEAGL